MAAKTFNFLKQKVGLQVNDPKSAITYIDIKMPYQISEESDITPLTDEAAIVNSVATMFSTRKLGRPLVPTYGLDLREYIGEPIDDDIKYFIRDDIIKTIEAWEPRIKVQKVEITSDEDNNEINIIMIVWFPTLRSSYTKIGLSINQNGIRTRSIGE